MAFRVRDIFGILRDKGPAHLVRFASARLRSYRSFKRWVQDLPPDAQIDDLVKVVVNRTLGEDQPVYAWQNVWEICGLLERLRPLQARRILEIGTAAGGTLLLFSRVAAPDAVLISIDKPEGNFGGGYNPLRSYLYRSLSRPKQRIVPIRADSHEASTVRRLGAVLQGELLDFLFVDGDHSEAGTRQDFEDYSRFVRPGGLIAFHDICADQRGWQCEVHLVWRELAARFAGEEFVDASGPRSYGIGLLSWPGGNG